MTTQKRRRAQTDRERLLATIPVTERRAEIAGVSTAVLEGGDGPPIVLLHGPGESSLWWMRVVPDLVATHRVIAPDLPGHGDSEVTDDRLDADGVLAWLDALIEQTCREPPALVGHLLGGAIAARFAADHGDRLGQVVLVDSLGLGRFRPSPKFAYGLIRFFVRPTERAYDGFLDQCTCDREALIERMGEDWEPFLACYLDRVRTPGVKAAVRTLMKEVGVPTIPPEELERITVPTTLIWGRHDRAVRLGTAEDASGRYGWPLHVIENAATIPSWNGQKRSCLRSIPRSKPRPIAAPSRLPTYAPVVHDLLRAIASAGIGAPTRVPRVTSASQRVASVTARAFASAIPPPKRTSVPQSMLAMSSQSMVPATTSAGTARRPTNTKYNTP
nr:alpha/beta fold hydrolase [Halobaculum salinum]